LERPEYERQRSRRRDRESNLCFAFSFSEKEKKQHADFALLNDFYEFPRSVLTRLADAKATDIQREREKVCE
jgi:hypothetical protein